MYDHDLQQEALKSLLALLDPDPDNAGKKYVALFQTLTSYFIRSGSDCDAEHLADLTMNTVARKSSEMIIENVRAYALGVAKKVALRRLDERSKLVEAEFAIDRRLDFPNMFEHGVERMFERAYEREQAAQKLDYAFKKLSNEDRYLIEKYYAESESLGERIARRHRMSRELGLTRPSLILRIHLIKQKLRNEVGRSQVTKRARSEARTRTEAKKGVRTEELKRTKFTAYYPRLVRPEQWNSVLAYMHVADTLSLVTSDAERRFGLETIEILKQQGRRNVTIERGTEILVIPESDLVEFNPSQAKFVWLEDFHCTEFRFRIRQAINKRQQAKTAKVRVVFYVFPLMVAEITFELRFGRESSKQPMKSGTVHPYLKVFVSYSHKDSDVADQLEKAYSAIGFEYLRDWRILKSGEPWRARLQTLINDAELFQLLWSRAAKQSPQVRQEWQYAHSLRRQYFIRPVYWEEPMPEPPAKLRALHFVYVELRRS